MNALLQEISSIHCHFRLRTLKVLLAGAFASSIFLSFTLFIDQRSYPLTKIVDFWPTLPSPLDVLFIICFLLILFIFSLLPLHHRLEKKLGWGLVGMGLLLVLADQNRLLPWFYQYFLM